MRLPRLLSCCILLKKRIDDFPPVIDSKFFFFARLSNNLLIQFISIQTISISFDEKDEWNLFYVKNWYFLIRKEGKKWLSWMSVNGGSQLEFRDRVILEICLCKNFIEFRNCGSMYWSKFVKKKKWIFRIIFFIR